MRATPMSQVTFSTTISTEETPDLAFYSEEVPVRYEVGSLTSLITMFVRVKQVALEDTVIDRFIDAR